MRLFVAIDLDEEARRAIRAEQQRILRALAGGPRTSLKAVREEQLHLTLAFIGEVGDETGAAIVETMSADVAVAPFTLIFDGLGAFPPQGPPHVLWIGVTTGAREAIEVQRQVAARLTALGIAVESRPYHPHLTLARWREARAADRARALAVDRHHAIARVEVRAVTLYRSQLSTDGSTYTVLARAPLVDCKA